MNMIRTVIIKLIYLFLVIFLFQSIFQVFILQNKYGMYGWMLMIIGGIVVIKIIWPIVQWLRNNAQPQISVEVRVVACDTTKSSFYVKRKQGAKGHLNFEWGYYITCELLSAGDRKKVWIPFKGIADQHNMIAEGSTGVLTLQGTRYISFRSTNSMEIKPEAQYPQDM